MKVLNVCGVKDSGKTTTIEHIIRELSARGYKVGSIKEIHFEQFAIDPDPQSNTNRHKAAGAGLVCARGLHETDILFPRQLSMAQILRFYNTDFDWVVVEGGSDLIAPLIITAHGEEDLLQKWGEQNGMVFCVSGRISAQIGEYRGVPVIDAVSRTEEFVNFIERRVYDSLPDFPPECCSACGMTCSELGGAILKGLKSRSDCVADKGAELTVGGRRINMVPFVQRILKNAVLGVVSELDGYEAGCDIEVRF